MEALMNERHEGLPADQEDVINLVPCQICDLFDGTLHDFVGFVNHTHCTLVELFAGHEEVCVKGGTVANG